MCHTSLNYFYDCCECFAAVASRCKVSMSSFGAIVNESVQLSVSAADLYGNTVVDSALDFVVTIGDFVGRPVSNVSAPFDAETALYVVNITLAVAGRYTVSVDLEGVAVTDAPIKLTIWDPSPPPSPDTSEVILTRLVSEVDIGSTQLIPVKMRDLFGQAIGEIPHGDYHLSVAIENGNFSVAFNRSTGEYVLLLSSSDIAGVNGSVELSDGLVLSDFEWIATDGIVRRERSEFTANLVNSSLFSESFVFRTASGRVVIPHLTGNVTVFGPNSSLVAYPAVNSSVRSLSSHVLPGRYLSLLHTNVTSPLSASLAVSNVAYESHPSTMLSLFLGSESSYIRSDAIGLSATVFAFDLVHHQFVAVNQSSYVMDASNDTSAKCSLTGVGFLCTLSADLSFDDIVLSAVGLSRTSRTLLLPYKSSSVAVINVSLSASVVEAGNSVIVSMSGYDSSGWLVHSENFPSIKTNVTLQSASSSIGRCASVSLLHCPLESSACFECRFTVSGVITLHSCDFFASSLPSAVATSNVTLTISPSQPSFSTTALTWPQTMSAGE
jgi:hypothetical protein